MKNNKKKLTDWLGYHPSGSGRVHASDYTRQFSLLDLETYETKKAPQNHWLAIFRNTTCLRQEKIPKQVEGDFHHSNCQISRLRGVTYPWIIYGSIETHLKSCRSHSKDVKTLFLITYDTLEYPYRSAFNIKKVRTSHIQTIPFQYF